MIPPAIIAASKLKRLDGIGITDHNSAANVEAVIEAAGGDLIVFGGMEVTTQEEIHLLALFGDLEKLSAFQGGVKRSLSGYNDPDRFGEQYIVDHEGYVTGIAKEFFSSATELTIEDVVCMTHDLDGIAIAAHIDRESFSIISQLGFIPESLPLDGVEFAHVSNVETAGIDDRNLPRFASSDAHTVDQIGTAVTQIRCERLTFEEMKLAITGAGGRAIKPVWK